MEFTIKTNFMVNLITILQYDKGVAYYQLQANKNETYSARLIKSSTNHRLPQIIEIEKDQQLKREHTIIDGITNKLVSVIKSSGAIEDSVSHNSLS